MSRTDRASRQHLRLSGNLPAIGAICAGTLCLVVSDAASKWLVDRYHPLQILFVRGVIAAPLVALLLWLGGAHGALRSHDLGVHATRGLLTVAATFAFVWSLGHLPLAEATALMFVAPLFLAALAVPILGEPLRARRLIALLVGFAGALFMMRPGAAAFQPASLAALAAAFLYAVTMIAARWINRRDSVWTVLFYVPLFGAVFTSFTLLMDWPDRRSLDLAAFVVSAVFGTVGVALITQSFRMAPAAVVAPFEYTAMIWASLIGWSVWSVVPAMPTWLGAAVIMGSGAALVWFERADARRDARASNDDSAL